MTAKKVTIKTIARDLGVTPSTVSKALRDGSDISIKTRERVKKFAEELGYQPNYLARSLVGKKSKIIGIIVPDISTSFFGFTVRGINENARNHSYETIILVNDENYVEERKNLEFLSKLQVDGIIIDTVPGEHNIDLIRKLNNRGIPFVFIDRKCESIDADSVTTDDIKAGYSLTNYCIKDKRKNIAFIGAFHKLSVADERMQGYKKALENSNIKFDEELIIPIDYKINNDELMNTVRAFIESGKKIDAFICAGGLIAYLVGLVLLEKGYTIPDDILFAEFGDNNIVHRLGVPFITVDQSPYQIGQAALNILIDRINSDSNSKKETHHVHIVSRLISHNPAAHKHILVEEI